MASWLPTLDLRRASKIERIGYGRDDNLGTRAVPMECLMPFVGSEIFGGIAADEPGEPGQDCSDDVLDDCDHELLLGSNW